MKQPHRQRRGRSPTIRDDDSKSCCSESSISNDDIDTNDNLKAPSKASQPSAFVSHGIFILIPCIILSSMIVTIFIFYIFGYGQEIYILYQEYKYLCVSQFHSKNNGQETSSFWLVSFLYRFSSRMNHNARMTMMSYHNLIKHGTLKEDYTNYTIYDIGNLTTHVMKKGNTSFLNEECKTKGSLSMENYKIQNENGVPQCRSILTKEMIETFHKDGVIAIRGLLSPELYNGLNQSSYDMMQKQLKKAGFRTSTGMYVQ